LGETPHIRRSVRVTRQPGGNVIEPSMILTFQQGPHTPGEVTCQPDQLKLPFGGSPLALFQRGLGPGGFHQTNQDILHLIQRYEHQLLDRILEQLHRGSVD